MDSTGDISPGIQKNKMSAALYIPIIPIKQNSRKKTAKLATQRVESAGRVIIGKPSKT